MKQTKKKIVELRKSNPCLTNADIARQVGLSREYVRVILAKSHLPTIAFFQHDFVCNNCGRTFYVKHVVQGSLYCSRECYSEVHHVKLPCSQCGKEFILLQSQFLERLRRSRTGGKIFCSKRCWGKYMAAHWGFGTR